MKTSSCKAKGRKLQQYVAEQISNILDIPWGKDELIRSREMAQSGVDVVLLDRAKTQFPWSVERRFSRAKEWLLLGCLKLRGLEQVAIHACLSFTAMLAVALAAVLGHEPGLMRSIKHFTV